MWIVRNAVKYSTRSDRDRGAILVWFAAYAIVLLGSGALVVDMGSLWSERRQLQNGADAAALAVGIDCAKTACTQSQAMALNYAELSATDGEAAVSLCGRGAGLTPCIPAPNGVSKAVGYVQALTSTWNPNNGGSSNQVRFVLAPLLDALQIGQTVRAVSTVAWGSLGTAMVIPIVISKCSFDPAWIAADGSLSVPNTPIKITSNDDHLCSLGWAAGFDFIKDTVGGCGATTITIGSTGTLLDAGSEGVVPQCRAVMKALYDSGTTFIVPVAKSRTPPGMRSTYLTDGFASFKLCGYALGGGYNENSCSPTCNGTSSQTRICGTFKTLTVNGGQFGDSTDYGTRVLKVVG